MTNKTSLYDILGVDKNATEDEIKRGYRKMALKYHPDKNRGDKEAEKMFLRIKEAYDILSDPRKKSMYDSMGEDAVKMMDNPSSFSPEVFLNIIHSSPASQRMLIFFVISAVIFAFFWFVSMHNLSFIKSVTLSLRIDSWIHWKWLIVMIPAFIVDAVIVVFELTSIPILIKKSRNNSDLDEAEEIAIGPELVDIFNNILFVVAQICFVLCLDGIWKIKYSLSLIPYFVYSCKCLYYPLYLLKKKMIKKNEAIYEASGIVIPITILFISLRFDHIIYWPWIVVFLPIWLYYGADILISSLIFRVLPSDNEPEYLMNRLIMRSQIIKSIFGIIVAIFVMLKISGIWKWPISGFVIIIMVIMAIFASCFLCSVCMMLFGNVVVSDDRFNGEDIESNAMQAVTKARSSSRTMQMPLKSDSIGMD